MVGISGTENTNPFERHYMVLNVISRILDVFS